MGGLIWGVEPIIHGGNQHLIDFSIVPNLGFQNSGTNLGGIINPDLTLQAIDHTQSKVYVNLEDLKSMHLQKVYD